MRYEAKGVSFIRACLCDAGSKCVAYRKTNQECDILIKFKVFPHYGLKKAC